jgi:hypothetical protein
MADPPFSFHPKTAYVLPLLPPSLGIDPLFAIVLHSVAFLDASHDEAVDPDAAIEAMESFGPYVARLSDGDIARYRVQCQAVARYLRESGEPDDVIDLVEGFFEQIGLEE